MDTIIFVQAGERGDAPHLTNRGKEQAVSIAAALKAIVPTGGQIAVHIVTSPESECCETSDELIALLGHCPDPEDLSVQPPRWECEDLFFSYPRHSADGYPEQMEFMNNRSLEYDVLIIVMTAQILLPIVKESMKLFGFEGSILDGPLRSGEAFIVDIIRKEVHRVA